MQRFLVLDFVGNYQGTTNAGLARLVATESGIPLSHTFLVARPDQTAVAQELAGLGGIEIVQTGAQAEKFVQVQVVLRLVQRLRLQLGAGETILVVSYSGPAMSNVLSAGAGQVETKSFRAFIGTTTLRAGASPGRAYPGGGRIADPSSLEILDPPAQGAIVWGFDWLCPLERALDSMVMALAKGAFNSVQHALADPHLRPRIAEIDPRFQGKGVMTGTQGMMGQLTMVGHERGLIGVARDKIKGTKFFWVLPSAMQNSRTQVTVATAPAPVSDVPTLAGDGITSNAMVASTVDQGASAPSNLLALTPSAALTEDERIPHRSRILQQVLHDAAFGPYTEGREKMFAEIEKLVSEKPGITKSHLLREAVNAAAADGKLAKNGKPQPWRKIAIFVEKLLSLTDALLGESGKAIGCGIQATTAPVHKLADSWRKKADAEIIRRLVDLVDDVGHDDHENLAGVLYLKRDQDACDQIESMLLYLVKNGKLMEIDVAGRLIYRFPPPPTELRVAQ